MPALLTAILVGTAGGSTSAFWPREYGRLNLSARTDDPVIPRSAAALGSASLAAATFPVDWEVLPPAALIPHFLTPSFANRLALDAATAPTLLARASPEVAPAERAPEVVGGQAEAAVAIPFRTCSPFAVDLPSLGRVLSPAVVTRLPGASLNPFRGHWGANDCGNGTGGGGGGSGGGGGGGGAR